MNIEDPANTIPINEPNTSEEMVLDEEKMNGMSEEEIFDYISKYSDSPEENFDNLSIILQDSSIFSPQTIKNICSILYKRAKSELLEFEEKLQKGIGDVRYFKQEIKRCKEEIKYLAPHAGIPDREEWRDRDPFIFTENNVQQLKELIKTWHSYKPDYIFLTETSAVPYGYAIKEAWRVAYPNEEAPTFYRIESWTEQAHIVELGRNDDIDSLIENSNSDNLDLPILNKMREGIATYLTNRIKKENARIIIFDQYDKMMNPQRIYNGDESSQTISGLAHELIKNFPKTTLYFAGVSNYGKNLDFGRSGFPINKKHPRVTLKRNVDHKNKESTLSGGGQFKGNRIDPLADQRPVKKIIQDILKNGYNPTGITIKDPERRKEALEYIKNLKEIGKITGKELLEESNLV